MSEKILAVVTGPTASGKTALAIALAQHYNTEIVSADSRQLFADLPIGTAAPTAEERRLARHHLCGVLPLDAYYSASRFEEDALPILDAIWTQHPVAIVCGGSMMYVDTLIRGIDDMPTITDATRKYVLELLENHGLNGVLAQLEICDPDYYAIVDKNNTRRVVHALEVSLQAGVPYSTLRTGQSKKRPFKVVEMAIDMPREQLFSRISARVEAMFDAGLEKEARRAFAQGDFNALNTVGYKELHPYFAGLVSLEDTKAKIARNTRVYAKKQITWLRRNPNIHWLNPETATDEAISLIDKAIME
ncbi:MAG: tRNA (adenosine(37)-N6)-dimethylallyltransferase MiaA [Muribaculaceae bacterium]|nr:tRNA (adenosine(37)-N6)-dimethylallyltransferase MiaA [Muribaculaceae bacterium]